MCMYPEVQLSELVRAGAAVLGAPLTFWKVFFVGDREGAPVLIGPWSGYEVKPGHVIHPQPTRTDLQSKIHDGALHAFPARRYADRFMSALAAECDEASFECESFLLTIRGRQRMSSRSPQEIYDRLVVLPIYVLPSEILAIGDHEGGTLNVAISGYVLSQDQYDAIIAEYTVRWAQKG